MQRQNKLMQYAVIARLWSYMLVDSLAFFVRSIGTLSGMVPLLGFVTESAIEILAGIMKMSVRAGMRDVRECRLEWQICKARLAQLSWRGGVDRAFMEWVSDIGGLRSWGTKQTAERTVRDTFNQMRSQEKQPRPRRIMAAKGRAFSRKTSRYLTEREKQGLKEMERHIRDERQMTSRYQELMTAGD